VFWMGLPGVLPRFGGNTPGWYALSLWDKWMMGGSAAPAGAEFYCDVRPVAGAAGWYLLSRRLHWRGDRGTGRGHRV
jgi:hypothetical protein